MKCSICNNDIPLKKKGKRADLCDCCDSIVDEALSIYEEDVDEEFKKNLERSKILG